MKIFGQASSEEKFQASWSKITYNLEYLSRNLQIIAKHSL